MAGLDNWALHLLAGTVWPYLGPATLALPAEDADDSYANWSLCAAAKSDLCQQYSDECWFDGSLPSIVDGSNNDSLVCGDFLNCGEGRREENLKSIRPALLSLSERSSPVDAAPFQKASGNGQSASGSVGQSRNV